MYDKVKVGLMSGEVVECYDMKPRVFNTWMVDELGLAKTRMKSMGEAVDNLHTALSKLDLDVRDELTIMSVGELVNKFGEKEEMYKSFKEVK